jgi:2-oxoglutarate ferredoxin oxidoreductase subunit alpha
MNAEAQDVLVRRLIQKIEGNRNDIMILEEDGIEDCDVLICSYGISARIARFAVERTREEGIKAGILRLITVWPFPEQRIREIARRVKAIIVPEINAGQIALEVERCACGQAETVLIPHMGGGVHRPESIIQAIRKAVK